MFTDDLSQANHCHSRLSQRRLSECWNTCLCRQAMMDSECNDCTDLALDGGVYSIAVFETTLSHLRICQSLCFAQLRLTGTGVFMICQSC